MSLISVTWGELSNVTNTHLVWWCGLFCNCLPLNWDRKSTVLCAFLGLLWTLCPHSIVGPSPHKVSPARTRQTARRIMWLWWVPVAAGEIWVHTVFFVIMNYLYASLCLLCGWKLCSAPNSRTQRLPPQPWVALAAQPLGSAAMWTTLHWTFSLDHPALTEK